jgi:hypothetical protein
VHVYDGLMLDDWPLSAEGQRLHCDSDYDAMIRSCRVASVRPRPNVTAERRDVFITTGDEPITVAANMFFAWSPVLRLRGTLASHDCQILGHRHSWPWIR